MKLEIVKVEDEQQPQQQRLEAAPKNASNLGKGDERYFRVDFVLGSDFPIEQTNSFCVINQIHHGGASGSPPVEFDVYNSALWVASYAGSSQADEMKISNVSRDTRYNLVYRVSSPRPPRTAWSSSG